MCATHDYQVRCELIEWLHGKPWNCCEYYEDCNCRGVAKTQKAMQTVVNRLVHFFCAAVMALNRTLRRSPA
jgi:hypothetical protein